MKCSGSNLDIILAHLFKDVFSTISPMVTAVINSSLAEGVVPANFKHASVQPMLKKPQLDPGMCSNYRPISKLPFISKLLEKVVLTASVFLILLIFWICSNLVLDNYISPSQLC